jgi:hypothetical protein
MNSLFLHSKNYSIGYIKNSLLIALYIFFSISVSVSDSYARTLNYEGQEVTVYVTSNQPTQLRFPGEITGGFIRKDSALSLKRVGSDLILFAKDNLSQTGESIIVRLKDGRSFSILVQQSADEGSRDTQVSIQDANQPGITEKTSERLPYEQDESQVAPPTQISGLMRELVLASEFGKPQIRGFKPSEQHRGEVVFDDGNLIATVDRIYTGPNLWAYVLDAENRLDQAQVINPGTFRLDGTRAISATRWELSPKPATMEEKISGAHKAKLYIITKAK